MRLARGTGSLKNKSYVFFAAMDVSQLNGAEQAHMTKVLEKKQVPPPPGLWLNGRCKISCDCIPEWWNGVLMLVLRILLVKH